MNTYQHIYGLVPHSINDEFSLPDSIKRTRTCKMNIVDYCHWIIYIAEQLENEGMNLPEDNDEIHVRAVEDFFSHVKTALDHLNQAVWITTANGRITAKKATT